VGCSCDEDDSGRLLPNEKTPCEWHFVFELLARPINSKRIQVLNVDHSRSSFHPLLEFGSCRFFNSPFPQLTTLAWKDDGKEYAHHLLSTSRPLPNLHSVTFDGRWNQSLARVNNLTSFTIKNFIWQLDAETLRLFVSNSRSLESLELYIRIGGGTKGPPVDLLNLKSLSIDTRPLVLSNIIRIPALQRLTSLRISLEDELGDFHTLRATGDGISLTAKFWAFNIMEDWQLLTGYARPTIRHVCVYDQRPTSICPYDSFSALIIGLMVDAYTVDIGLTYSGCWGGKFWTELKQLGPQLKLIRFEVSGDMEPYGGPSNPDAAFVDRVLSNIVEMVEYRFKEGRPFSAVERMAVSEDEQVDRSQENVWRQFWDDHRIGEYVVSV